MRPFVLNKTFVYRVNDDNIRPKDDKLRKSLTSALPTTCVEDQDKFKKQLAAQTSETFKNGGKVTKNQQLLGFEEIRNQPYKQIKRNEECKARTTAISQQDSKTFDMATSNDLTMKYADLKYQPNILSGGAALREKHFDADKLQMMKSIRFRRSNAVNTARHIHNNLQTTNKSIDQIEISLGNQLKLMRPNTGKSKAPRPFSNTTRPDSGSRNGKKVATNSEINNSLQVDRFQFVNGVLQDTRRKHSNQIASISHKLQPSSIFIYSHNKTNATSNGQSLKSPEAKTIAQKSQFDEVSLADSRSKLQSAAMPAQEFESVRKETLFRKFKFPLDADAFLVSQNISPLFLWKTDEMKKVFKLIGKGDATEAVETLSKMKNSYAKRNNLAVCEILAGNFNQALQILGKLHKKFPESTSILANLMFTYLCTGLVDRLCAITELKLVSDIQPPLTEQTRAILAMLSHAQTSPLFKHDQMKTFSEQANSFLQTIDTGCETRRKSTTQKSSKSHRNQVKKLSNLVNPQLNSDSDNEETTNKQFQNNDQLQDDNINFHNFIFPKKKRRFSQTHKIVPINHLLKQTIKPEIKIIHGGIARSSELQHNAQSDLETYKRMIKTYREADSAILQQKQDDFDQELVNVRQLCAHTEEFQRGVSTQIVKGPGRHIQKENKDVVNTNILQPTKIDARSTGSKLDNLDIMFMKLLSTITIHDTYQGETVQEAYEELIEEIRLFNDRFPVTEFVNMFIEGITIYKQSQRQTVKNLWKKFSTNDPKLQRASGFIMSCLQNAKIEEALVVADCLQQMIAQAKENRRKGEQDSASLIKEQEFGQIIRDLTIETANYKRKQRIAKILKKKQRSQDRIMPSGEHDLEELKIMCEWIKQNLNEDDSKEKLKKKKVTSEIDIEEDKVEEQLPNNINEWIKQTVHDQLCQQYQQFKQDSQKQVKSKLQPKLNLKDLEQQICMLYNEFLVQNLVKCQEISSKSYETRYIKIFGLSKGDYYRKQELQTQVEKEINYDRLTANPLSEEKKLFYEDLDKKARDLKDKEPLSFEDMAAVKIKVRKEVAHIERRCKRRLENTDTSELSPTNDELFSPELERQRQRKVLKSGLKKFQRGIREFSKKQFVIKQIFKEHKIKKERDGEVIDSQLQRFNSETMKVLFRDIQQKKLINPWFQMENLGYMNKMKEVEAIVANDQVLYDRDSKRQVPIIKKWGIPTEMINDENLRRLAGEDREATKAKDTNPVFIKPNVGKEMDLKLVEIVEDILNQDYSTLGFDEKQKLDKIMLANNKVFSTFEKIARDSMYKNLRIERISGYGTVIEQDAEDTQVIQIILRGRVQEMLYKHDLNTNLEIGVLIAGEVCGDESIQRKFTDVLKVVQKDRKFYKTITEEVIVAKIHKKHFVSAIFQEMSEELFYKIQLLRSTPYFKDLSPYSLVTIASNIEVREMKYGEIVIYQGEVPEAMYILAYGNIKSVFLCAETQTTEIVKNAKNTLKCAPKPFQHGPIDQSATEIPQKHQICKDGTASTSTLQVQPETETEYIPSALGRVFKNSILYVDKNNKQIAFQDHVDLTQTYINIVKLVDKTKLAIRGAYEPVNQDEIVQNPSNQKEFIMIGQTIGQRALLESQAVREYIVAHKKEVCERLRVNIRKAEHELNDWIMQMEDQEEQQRQKRARAIKGQTKFCKKCFESGKQVCKCLLEALDQDQRELALQEEQNQNQQQTVKEANKLKNDTSLEFNVSLFSDPGDEHEQTVSQSFTKVKRNVKNRLKENKRTKTPEKVEPPKEEQDELKKQQKIEDLLVDRLQTALMRSQASVVVSSATAKFLVVRKEDKNFLDAYLKQCISLAVLNTDFYDYDRPLQTFEAVQKEVARKRGYSDWKLFYQDVIFGESKIAKQKQQLEMR